MHYLITLEIDSNSNLIQSQLELQGANSFEFFDTGIFICQSVEPLNLNLVGIKDFQEVMVAKEYCYNISLLADSDVSVANEAMRQLEEKGIRIVRYYSSVGMISVDADTPVDFADIIDIPGIVSFNDDVEIEEELLGV